MGDTGGKIAITPHGKSEVIIDFGSNSESPLKRHSIPKRKQFMLNVSRMPKFTHTRKNTALQSMHIIPAVAVKDDAEIVAEKTIAQFLNKVG